MAISYGSTQCVLFWRVFLLVHTLLPWPGPVVEHHWVHLLWDCVAVGGFVQMICLSLCHDFQWGGAGVWGVYRNYEPVDVRLTYFKVCILSSCEHGEGCSQSWLKDVIKSTWTFVRCLELWIIWQKNKNKNRKPFSRQRHVG